MLKKMELKCIILRDRKLFVDMSGTFPKFPNNGINEINPQKISERLHIQYADAWGRGLVVPRCWKINSP